MDGPHCRRIAAVEAEVLVDPLGDQVSVLGCFLIGRGKIRNVEDLAHRPF